MADVITNPKLKKFLESNINSDFGLTVDQVANKCKSYGRFNAWLNQDVTRIKAVLNKVKNNGVSPAFFAAYERTEGYNSKWGWLNHTKVNGDPITDANSVSQWIVSQSKNTTDKPAWIDYANYKDFVPASVKEQGNAHFANMPAGSIGKVIIAGTAAATWETYYPNGLKKEYNGVQDYAPPNIGMVNTIEAWGGTIDGSNPNPDPDPDPDPDPPEIDFSKISQFFDKFSTDTQKEIIKMLNKNLFDYGGSQYFGNHYVRVNENLPKTYQINVSKKFKDEFNNLFKKAKKELEKILGDINIPDPSPDPDPDPEPDPDDKEMYFPVDYTKSGINFWSPPYSAGSVQEQMEFGYDRGTHVHAGYDIGGGGVTGHKVYAIRSGEVTFVGSEGTRGFVIRIKHSTDDNHTMYMHLVNNSNTVKVGDKVKAGQHIANMGNTPNGMYSIHLHVEVDTTGNFAGYSSQLNPRPYLKVTGNNKTSLPNPANK